MTLVFPPNWICMYNSCLCTLKFWFGHWWIFSSAAQLCLTLRPHGLQHTRFPCPSLTLRACSNWSPPSWMKSIQPSHSLSSPSPAFYLSQHQGLFQGVSSSHQMAEILVFSFSISASNAYSGLISFRMDWLDLPAVQRTLKSLLEHHSSKASILWCSAFFIV